MKLLNIKLVNFRNYKNDYFEFSPHYNLIVGNNGVGKTNLVEAIYFLALTKSFKTNNDNILVNKDSNFFNIEGTIKERTTNKYKVLLNKGKKTVYFNDNNIRRLSDYISLINTVVFSKEDFKLIKDSPSVKRKIIDMDISQNNNDYVKKLSLYNKILRQRNSYLKSVNINHDYLNILTSKLIDYGIIINDYRVKYISSINKELNKYFLRLNDIDKLHFEYNSAYTGLTKDELLKIYKRNLNRDIRYTQTNTGIHLDDYIFTVDDINVRDYLSEGQQKNVLLSYKLCQIDNIKKEKGYYPIFIIDDLISELDNSKIRNVFKELKEEIQIFITATSIVKINKEYKTNSKIIRLKENKNE